MNTIANNNNSENENIVKDSFQKEETANMTIGERLFLNDDDSMDKEFCEKNKLYFFLMHKNLLEEYIAFCSLSPEEWVERFRGVTVI